MWPFTRKTGSTVTESRDEGHRVQRSLARSQRPRESGADTDQSRNLKDWPGSHALMPLPDDNRVAVVGESHYQRALRTIAGGRITGDGWDKHIPAMAVLVPEPNNRWDTNAVRVDALHGGRALTVGYLASELADEYQPELLRLRDAGYLGSCPARIAGGGSKFYGIYLHCVYPRELRIFLRGELGEIAEERDGRAILHSDVHCTVTKEEQHQDVLLPQAPSSDQDYREVSATLGFCDIATGKYKGEQAVEVRIGGQRVGQLTHAMTMRYADVVRRVLDRGLQPSCTALVTVTPRGLQVELVMPQMQPRD